jgi:hypothetical protein
MEKVKLLYARCSLWSLFRFFAEELNSGGASLVALGISIC